MNRRQALYVVALALVALSPRLAQATHYGATYSPAAIPPLLAGQTHTVAVTVKNTGSGPNALTWTPTGANPVRLSYHWYQAGTQPTTAGPNFGAVVWNGERTTLPGQVRPGQSVTLQATLKAPSTPGSYTLKWDLVHEGVTWFSQKNVPTKDQAVTVNPGFGGPAPGWSSRVAALEGVKTLQVMCRLVDCAPKITSVFPFSVIKPGGGVIVLGELFGGARYPGQLLLKGLRRWDGAPVGDLALEGLSWDDTAVGGTIPWVTGVRDQDATLQVVTKAGHASNEQKVRFTAARAADRLPPRHARVVTCSQASDHSNRCVAGPGTSDLASTLAGQHVGRSNAYGSDIFYAALQNDWVFDGYAWVFQTGIQGGPLGFHPGSFQTQLAVNWFHDELWGELTGVYGYASYLLDLYITGPDGVPY
jgi:hypothetical protein